MTTMTVGDVLRELRLELPRPERRTCGECGSQYNTKFRLSRVCDRCVAERRRVGGDAEDEYRAQRRARLAAVGIEGTLGEMTLEAFEESLQPVALASARRFVDDWPHERNLVLLGRPGAGKTHLVVGVLLALWQKGIPVRYAHLPTILAQMKRAPDFAEAERLLVDPLFSAKVVVLDDIGREKGTDHLSELLDALINNRWINGQPTIIAGILTPRDLLGWLGGANYSRLRDNGGQIIELQPGDMRLGKTQRPLLQSKGRASAPCPLCKGAGFGVDETARLGTPHRVVPCPACHGRDW